MSEQNFDFSKIKEIKKPKFIFIVVAVIVLLFLGSFLWISIKNPISNVNNNSLSNANIVNTNISG